MFASRFLLWAVLCVVSACVVRAQDLGPQIAQPSSSAQLTITAKITDAAQVAFALPPEVLSANDALTNAAHHAAPLTVTSDATANNFALDLDAARRLNTSSSATGLRLEARRGGWWYSVPLALTVRSTGLRDTVAPFAVRVAVENGTDAPILSAPVTLPAGATTITQRVGFFVSHAPDAPPIKIRVIYHALLR